MRKVFLYLYPIEEYTKVFLNNNNKESLIILNETINKRYREKGYEVVFALYPDTKLYGLGKKDNDKIIYTDILFKDATIYDKNGNEKKDFKGKYPSEISLLKQIGYIDKLVVGGYHAMDCVKKVAETAMESGIDTLVDLDLTELFFNIFKDKDYFDMENYNPLNFKTKMINRVGINNTSFAETIFNRNYRSPVYGFINEKKKKL